MYWERGDKRGNSRGAGGGGERGDKSGGERSGEDSGGNTDSDAQKTVGSRWSHSLQVQFALAQEPQWGAGAGSAGAAG